MITIGQIKAARAFLELTQAELAEKAGISLAALNKLERGIVEPHRATVQALQIALEKAGIEFTNDGSPGVKLKK